jgi:uncharacterized protein YbjT (DUF2867 family)
MIVITAPTGHIGRKVLSNVLDQGGNVRVIARNPSKLPTETRGRFDVIEGSHADLDVVMKAFEGADTVFWLVTGDMSAPSANAAFVDFSQAGCEAMKACGVKRVVGISALGRGWPRDAGHATATLKLDDMIAQTGVSYRALACGSLMENVLRQVVSIRDQGVFYGPHPGDFKATMVATRDVADVASRLLLDSTWTGVDSIPMMGPEDVASNEMARIMSDVLAKSVAYQEISIDALRTMAAGRGATEGMVQALANMMIAKNEGIDVMIPRTDPSETPTSFRQWCEQVLKPAVQV